MKINILGTPYTVKECSPEEEPYLQNCDGYCDKTSKTICASPKRNLFTMMMFSRFTEKKLLRHEIIHAFMNESGLQENFEHPNRYGHDETTIDWFAIQFTKLLAAFKEADCLE